MRIHFGVTFVVCLFHTYLCRDFYVGMFKKDDLLMASDTLFKEAAWNGRAIAKYGRLLACPITYFRVVDRLGVGRMPTVQIIRGGLRQKFLVLRITSAYKLPISVDIYLACENNLGFERSTHIARPTTTTIKAAADDDTDSDDDVAAAGDGTTVAAAAGAAAAADGTTAAGGDAAAPAETTVAGGDGQPAEGKSEDPKESLMLPIYDNLDTFFDTTRDDSTTPSTTEVVSRVHVGDDSDEQLYHIYAHERKKKLKRIHH